MSPLSYGDYPHSMRKLVGRQLPKFTPRQSMLIKGSFDFLGLNYYTANYAAHVPVANTVNVSYSTDSLVKLTNKFIQVPQILILDHYKPMQLIFLFFFL